MDISVTFRHMEPTEALKDYAREKLDRIKKFMRRPIEAHVVFSVEKHYHIAEVTLRVNGIAIRGRERTEDMYSSIDAVVDKLDYQVRRYKERLRDHHAHEKPAPDAVAVALVEHQVVASEDHKDESAITRVVKTEKVPAELMLLDDAIMHMDLSNEPFMVFTNLANNRVCVLYRMGEGNYGLIETGQPPPTHTAGSVTAN
ncbi:MAG TPA: ribosome-associated translation inhibitor RaiA [Myxococcota bacterium]|jgi:putative sigma-54 modulation protein|nr:ribosome-associated translation inhibitor RaiA [Myxococcota bacterium]